MKTLLLILSMIFGEVSMEHVDYKDIAFEKLPTICKNEYEPTALEFFKRTSTYVAYCDLDGDGEEEILSFDGLYGTGGLGWNIISKNKKIANVFGDVFFVNLDKTTGLLFKNRCGWSSSTWSYYELKNSKLELLYEIETKHLINSHGQISIKSIKTTCNNKK